jgi:hypothetical protein
MFHPKKIKINFGIGRAKILNWIMNPIINLNHEFYCRFFAWIQRQFPTTDPEWMKKVVMSYNQGVAGTKRGNKGALPYWDKFQKNMAILNERQP